MQEKRTEREDGLIRFFILRHGDTDYGITHDFTSGLVDLGLNDLGVEQAASAAQSLKKTLGDLIPYFYTSTLLRAVETTNIIKGPFPEAEVIQEPLLEEHYYGDYSTLLEKSKKELLKRKPDDAEPWLSFIHRTISSITKILLNHFRDLQKKDHPIVIVSHKGLFEMLSLFLTGTIKSIGNGEIIEFFLKTDGAWNISRINGPIPENKPVLSNEAKKMKEIEDQLRIYKDLVKIQGDNPILTMPRNYLLNLLQFIQRINEENSMLFEENRVLREIIKANELPLPGHITRQKRVIPIGSYLNQIQFFSSTNSQAPSYPNKRTSTENLLQKQVVSKKILFQFYIVRHADTDWKFDKSKGPEDLPVNSLGRQQGTIASSFLLKQLVDFSNTVLITSAQKRSIGTAAIFLESIQTSTTTLIKEKAFSGLYYGDYSTIKDNSIKPRDAESIRSFQKRVSQALYKMILQYHQAQPLILFSHRRVFEFLSLYLLGTMQRIECGDVGHFICYEDGSWGLATFKYEENSQQFIKSKVKPEMHCVPPYLTDEEEALNKIRTFLLSDEKTPIPDPDQWSQELYKEHKAIKKILKRHLQDDRIAYHKKLEQGKFYSAHPEAFLNRHEKKNSINMNNEWAFEEATSQAHAKY